MLITRQFFRIGLAGLAAGWLLLVSVVIAADDPVHWKTGPALRRQLDEAVGITWQDRALREGLDRLSQTCGVAIFLDRRIDPDQLVTVTVRDQPLETLLRQVASEVHAGIALVGAVVYLGPPATSTQLATLAALRRHDVAKMPNEAKARLLRSQAWQWDELAQPGQLLEELARQAGVTVENANAIPLDLWPAVNLPSLAWTDRLTLLLAGFGLTFEIDERATTVRLVAQPASAIVEKRYTPRASATELATQLRRVMPEATIKLEQGQLVVAARQEDHDKIERLLSGQSVRVTKPAKSGGEKLYTLHTSEQPAGAVVRKIAGDLGKELKYDSGVLNQLKQPVKLDLEKVTIDYLLETILKPLKLTYRITDEAVEIVPAN